VPALDAEQYQALIILEVGDVDSLVADNISACWDLYSELPVSREHYLRAKLKALDLLMGAVRGDVQFAVQGDLQVWQQQKLAALVTLRTAAESDLTHELRRGARATVSVLSTTAPITSPTGAPDANASTYRGNPNAPWPGRVQP
jgi:hypothetical protein